MNFWIILSDFTQNNNSLLELHWFYRLAWENIYILKLSSRTIAYISIYWANMCPKYTSLSATTHFPHYFAIQVKILI